MSAATAKSRLAPITITVRDQTTLRRLHKVAEMFGWSAKRAASWEVSSGAAETIRLAEEEKKGPPPEQPQGVKILTLEELFKACDIARKLGFESPSAYFQHTLRTAIAADGKEGSK